MRDLIIQAFSQFLDEDEKKCCTNQIPASFQKAEVTTARDQWAAVLWSAQTPAALIGVRGSDLSFRFIQLHAIRFFPLLIFSVLLSFQEAVTDRELHRFTAEPVNVTAPPWHHL